MRTSQHRKMLIAAAIGAALIAILAQITIPFPIVPNTAQPLGIGLIAVILGKRYGTLSVFLYCLLGAIGIPVFAGMSGGFGIILGPTGGYIVGFTLAAYVVGFFTSRFPNSYTAAVIGAILGVTVIILLFGLIWLKFQSQMSWSAAFSAGVLPFIFTNPIQAVAAALLGQRIKGAMSKAGVLREI